MGFLHHTTVVLLITFAAAAAAATATVAVRAGSHPTMDAPTDVAADSIDFDHAVRPFIAEHCVSCHTGAKAKAGLELAPLLDLSSEAALAEVRANREDWIEVRDRVRHHEMPPAGEPRPDPAELSQVVAWVQAALTAAEGTLGPGPSVVRRLNRVEYRNTIRDLLGVDFDPDETFPADDVAHGFDNNAGVLTLSPLLLEKYLTAAETIAARAVLDPTTDGLPRIAHDAKTLETDRGQKYGSVMSLSTSGEVFFKTEVLREGRYRLHSRCYGQQAGPQVVRAAFRIDGKNVKTVDVPATRGDPGSYVAEFALSAGDRRLGIAFINDYYQPKDPDPTQRDRNFYVIELALEGPLDAPNRSAFQRRWVPENIDDSSSALRTVISTTARRAFRAPVTDDVVDGLLAVVARATDPSDSFETQLRVALTAMLVSPRFLFRLEPDPLASDDVRNLTGHELASRLSYFLWSSMPDDALFAAADAGTLSTEAGLRDEALRLLRDPRAAALGEHFATQWLQIRDLDRHVPDPVRFPKADALLREAMRRETVLLFDAVLRERRPVWTLLDADFTFVNEPLAQHYGLPGVTGPWMRRVPVSDADPILGGLLGHASVLTATSNATRTSPVKRGKWILEALLDSPPPPPPPEVDGLREQEAGEETVSLRTLLEEHRADPACATCHTRMDALGFGLEGYDPVGRPRTRDGKFPIDASGELPDGRRFEGAAELRSVLLGDRDFLRSLAKHLTTYAIGRGLTPDDEPALERLTRALESDPTLERLITEITQLDLFRRKRVDSASDDTLPSIEKANR